MIVYKQWRKRMPRIAGISSGEWIYEGWFLFGFLPIYIRRFGHER